MSYFASHREVLVQLLPSLLGKEIQHSYFYLFALLTLLRSSSAIHRAFQPKTG